MFVRLRRDVPAQELIDLRFEMGDAFGSSHFLILKDGSYGAPRRAIERIDRYEQDGDDILPEPGETFLEIYLWTRYYGPGYERGDAVFLIALADWLETRTGGQVWYGGDSSGVLAVHFDRAERAAMWRHFIKVGHLPYRGDPRVGDARSSILMGHEKAISRRCGFCEVPMARNGFGQHYAGFYCSGCGARHETHDDGQTWTEKTEHD